MALGRRFLFLLLDRWVICDCLKGLTRGLVWLVGDACAQIASRLRKRMAALEGNDDGLIMLLLFPVLAPHLHLEERSSRLGMR